MAEPSQIVSGINQKIASSFTAISVLNVIGWIIFILLLIGGGWWLYIYYKNKRIYSKRITAFEPVGDYWQPAIRDVAKIVKIGKGGFEILYLKKLKTWKIAYGGRVGRNDYYFYIMPDGYWYNGMMSANVYEMDDLGGLIPIKTTNPLMRGQYTALEKQIDSLTGRKQNWWDRYGSWVLNVAFLLIAGVLLWMMFREFSSAMGQLSTYSKEFGTLLDKVNTLIGNIQSNPQTPQGGLVPV